VKKSSEPLIEERSLASDIRVAELCGKNSYMVAPKTQLSLDLDRAADIIGKTFKLKARAAFGLTFDYSEHVTISLMKTGNMLIKGVGDETEALQVYNHVMKALEGS